MKRNLPTISAILYTSKTLANGEHPIMLRVCYNGKRKYKSMGISCKPQEWSDDKQRVKGKRANSLNTIITKELADAQNYVLSLEGKADYSASTIVSDLQKTAPTRLTLFSLFEERIEFFKVEKGKYNTATGYRTLLNRIKKYTNGKDLELFEVTTNWLRSFEEYLRCHYVDNSIRKFFDCFQAIFNYAITKEYIKETPFTTFQFSKKLNCQTRKRALTLQEITSLMVYYLERYGKLGIENNDVYGELEEKQYWVNQKFKLRGTNKLTPINAEQFSLALFLCSYHFQGMALIDLANLKKKDIHLIQVTDRDKFVKDSAEHDYDYAMSHLRKLLCYEINITRHKTTHPTRVIVDARYLIPYLNPFGSYIDDGDDLDEDELEDYLFPIFDKDDDTEEKKFGRMTYMNYLVNVNLKRIAKRLGFAEGITFYSARHSYASALYHANVPMGLIAQNMGRNPAEIETYLKEFDVENIYKANEKALITGQEDYLRITEKQKQAQRDKTRKELEGKGEFDTLKMLENWWRFMDEH